MVHDSWVCLVVEKGPGVISTGVRSTLKMFACALHRTRQDKMLITSDFCSGHIETTWATHLIGTKGGVLFRAQLDDERGDFYQVNFLYSTDDLEKGANKFREMDEEEVWVQSAGRLPLDLLYEFPDPISRRLN